MNIATHTLAGLFGILAFILLSDLFPAKKAAPYESKGVRVEYIHGPCTLYSYGYNSADISSNRLFFSDCAGKAQRLYNEKQALRDEGMKRDREPPVISEGIQK